MPALRVATIRARTPVGTASAAISACDGAFALCIIAVIALARTTTVAVVIDVVAAYARRAQ